MENAASNPGKSRTRRKTGTLDLVMNQHTQIETPRRLLIAAGLLVVLIGAGCARSPGVAAPGTSPGQDGGIRHAQLLDDSSSTYDETAAAEEDYDPWQPF